MKASVAIFQKFIEEKYESCPDIPNEVFEAIKEVVKTRSTKVVNSSQGMYIIAYSEMGPWKETMDGWLPVRVIKPIKWSSGGCRVEEMELYDKEN